jgi:hypothetical protein
MIVQEVDGCLMELLERMATHLAPVLDLTLDPLDLTLDPLDPLGPLGPLHFHLLRLWPAIGILCGFACFVLKIWEIQSKS